MHEVDLWGFIDGEVTQEFVKMVAEFNKRYKEKVILHCKVDAKNLSEAEIEKMLDEAGLHILNIFHRENKRGDD